MRKRTWTLGGLFVLLLLGAYFVTRLYHLTLLPIFTDEAIYIRWSQIGSRDASWRFISLVDGKQPMFTWIMMVVLRFIKDPLTAGRLVSVGAGLLSMVGIWFLSFEVTHSKRVSFLTSFIYLVCPFTLMYDRLALYDSLVAAFSIWNLYMAILLVRYVRLDVALILGMTLGMGMLNKSSGFLSLYMLPGTLLLFDWKKKKIMSRLLQWIGLVLLSAFLSEVMYSVLRLSPLFNMVTAKDAVFVYSFKEWLSHPFNFLQGNMHGLLDWLIHYLTIPVFITSFLPIVFFRKLTKEKILLYGWCYAPIVALALFGRVLYPRFILFMAMPLLVLVSIGLIELGKKIPQKIIMLLLCVVVFGASIWTDYYILTNPLKAPIPKADSGQLLNDWPAGWGVREVNAFITEHSKNSKITIYTDGTFGLLPYAFEMYQLDNHNVTIKSIWPIPQIIPDAMVKDAAIHPTYMVFNQLQIIPDWPISFISAYQKGTNSATKMRLYQINPALIKK
ncbi:MAG TPA: glycosyltransferase family 39 protein [Patescibacteria group bacterium]|nr:glycosyltransferase family 39 protein [Patescibacteria group bacterium]